MRRLGPLTSLVAAGLFVACAPSAGVATVDPTVPASTEPSAPTSTAAPSSTPSTAPSASADAPIRIHLLGAGPLGLDIVDGTAFVAMHDSGQLAIVDLRTGKAEVLPIGDAVTHALALSAGRVVVAAYQSDGERGPLVIVDVATSTITDIATEPLGGIAIADAGRLWGFESAGAIVLADPVAGTVLERVPIEITQNEHIDIVAAAGSAWASSDSTPVRRIGGSPASVQATIETGGGIPLAVAGGLVWGARPSELWAIDPDTNEVVRRFALTDVMEVLSLDVADDEAWIAIRHPGYRGAVIRLDLTSGDVIFDTPVSLPAGVRIDGDRAWVTDFETGVLLGIPRG